MTAIKFHTKLIQSILDPVAQQVSAEGDSVILVGLKSEGERARDFLS